LERFQNFGRIMGTLTLTETPEERELAAKRKELETLRSRLADAELEYHTLRVDLAAFEALYLQIVGQRLARLDELQAHIAEARAARQPKNEKLAEEARKARADAHATAEAFESGTAKTENVPKARPSDDCRRLYIQAAKAIHPDLAPSPEEKARRHRFMTALNEAYEAGDVERIRRILQEWNASPESVTGDGVGAELIRIIRQIAQVETRLRELKAAREALMQSDLYKLWQAAISSEFDATKHLQRMAAGVDEEVESMEWEEKQIKAATKTGRGYE